MNTRRNRLLALSLAGLGVCVVVGCAQNEKLGTAFEKMSERALQQEMQADIVLHLSLSGNNLMFFNLGSEEGEEKERRMWKSWRTMDDLVQLIDSCEQKPAYAVVVLDRLPIYRDRKRYEEETKRVQKEKIASFSKILTSAGIRQIVFQQMHGFGRIILRE